MSSTPPDDVEEDDDGSDDFLREVARVENRPPPSTEARARLEGTNIGRFKVVSEIGRGGMGIVFLAEDEKLRRKVALKLLPPSFAADEERRRRFLREARAAAAVSHPNLVTVYDVGEHEGRAYIAMEYLRGRSLRELLGERQLSVDEAVELVRQILAGLAHAHAAGLLHRDLKPENVLVDRDGRVRLVDFGLAKLDGDIDGPGESSTHDGLVVGTPGYMSPEQARGQAVDARTDIFSLGVVFYETLTRKRPFTGPTRADVVTSLLRDEPRRVDLERPEVGVTLGEVVHRCLAKAPEDRFPSSAALQDALEDAWTAPKKQRLTPTPTPAPADSGGPTKKRSQAWAWMAAAACIALGGVGFAITQRPAPTAAPAAPEAGPRKGLAMTDLPLPTSNSPDALASYRQGLQAIRDADWAIAEDRLGEATKHDPELSAAYLRLAILAGTGYGGPARAREQLSRAVTTRVHLSERDQALLMAVEPLINRDPSDKNLARERLHDLVTSRPDDAELWHFYAIFGPNGEDEGIAAERTAVALDPQFADAWQILAAQLAQRGKVDEALAAIERCVVISPLTADCRGERARLYGVLGECTRMEEDLRRGLSSNPRAATIWQDDRAAALVAVGRTDDTVLEAYRQKWALLPEAERKGIELLDRALLATARGRFGEADVLLVEGEKAIERDANAQIHARYSNVRIAIAEELGRPKDAAKIAASYVAKKDVWIGSGWESEVPMLRVMVRGGLLSDDDFAKRRDAWYSSALATERGRPALHLWALGYADYIQTPAEGRAAMEALPPELDGASGIHIEKESFTHAQLGNALLLAGHADAALRYLEEATLACNWLHWPVRHTHALLHLGQAHEALGQTESACEAYHRVVARWATAPKSSTRDTAKARLKALACGTEARRAPHRASPMREGGPGAEPDEEPQDDESSKTITRGAEGRAAERGPACAEAKRAAIAKTMCAKQKSVEGDCDCNRRSNEWVCAAMMAVTCN